MPHAYWCLLFNFEILAEVFQTDAQVRKALREKTKTKKSERERDEKELWEERT